MWVGLEPWGGVTQLDNIERDPSKADVRQLRKPVNETEGCPLFEMADPKVRNNDETKRLSKQCMVILGRLMVGPVTNTELMKIAQRFGARLHDLRMAGYDIETQSRDNKTGVVWYNLKGQP